MIHEQFCEILHMNIPIIFHLFHQITEHARDSAAEVGKNYAMCQLLMVE